MKYLLSILFICSPLVVSSQITEGLSLKKLSLKGNVKKVTQATEGSYLYDPYAIEVFDFNRHGQLISITTMSKGGILTGRKDYEYLTTKDLKLSSLTDNVLQEDIELMAYKTENPTSNYLEAYQLGYDIYLVIFEYFYIYDDQENLIECTYPIMPLFSDVNDETLKIKNIYDHKKRLVGTEEIYIKDSVVKQGNKKLYTYNLNNQLITEKQITPEGNTDLIYYNNKGEIIKMLNHDKSTTLYKYNKKGNYTSIFTTDTLGKVLSTNKFEYDIEGELIFSEYDDKINGIKNKLVTNKTFWPNNILQTKTEKHSEWLASYGVSTFTTTTYNEKGIPVKEIQKTTIIDENGEIIEESSKELTPEVFEYDTQGNWISNGIQNTRIIEYY
jgi:YD repeat-containing protein